VLSINASQSVLKDHALAALQYAFLQNRKVGVSCMLETKQKIPSDSEIDTASASYEIARELVEWSEKFVLLDDDSTEPMSEEKDEHKSNDEDRKHFKKELEVDLKKELEVDLKKELEADRKIQKVDCSDMKGRNQVYCDDPKRQKQWNAYNFPNFDDDDGDGKKITIGILCNNFPLPEKKFEKRFPMCPSFDFFADDTENTGPLYSDDLLEVPSIPSTLSECDDLDFSPLSSPFSDAGSNLSD